MSGSYLWLGSSPMHTSSRISRKKKEQERAYTMAVVVEMDTTMSIMVTATVITKH